MKNKSKIIKKDFDCVKFFRKVKRQISKETYGLSYEELRAYYDKVKPIHPDVKIIDLDK